MTQKTLADVIGGTQDGGYLGFAECRPEDAGDARIAVIGAATATPYPAAGAYCADGPMALRAASRLAAGTVQNMDFELGGPLLPDGIRAVDCGDIAVTAQPKNDADSARNRRAIQEAVQLLAGEGRIPFVLGGDDSVPIPVAAGLAEGAGPLSVVQVDAHIDWRPDVGGEHMGLSSTMRRISEMPHVGQIVQIGRRGAGSATSQDVSDALARGVRFVDARDLTAATLGEALGALPKGGRVLICFDADALDPSIMPAVIGRLPGGLSYWQAIDLLAACARQGQIAGFCFTEFMPAADIGGLGALTASRVITTAIGLAARQPAP